MGENLKNQPLEFEKAVCALMEQDYCILDDFLDPSDTQGLLDALQQKQQSNPFKPAGIGRGTELQHNPAIRGDEIMWLENNETEARIRRLLDKVEGMIAYFNQSCYAGIRDYEAHFAIYPPQAYYHLHLDQFQGSGHRRYTFILYLNFDWKVEHGGCLRIHPGPRDGGTVIDIAPVAGRFVCFRSNAIPHEVLVTHRHRYSVTGWWLNQEKTLGFL
jgi:SM-20-related protein